jgi:protein-arginine kinase activator protein McsA
MKCDECEQESNFLIPVRAVNDKEVKDLRLCSYCFEIFRNPKYSKHLRYNKMSYPHFSEGSCKACGSETKYLREVSLNITHARRDILLCPSCYKELLFLKESGALRDFPPYISGIE